MIYSQNEFTVRDVNLTWIFKINYSCRVFYLSASLFDRLSWSFEEPELIYGYLQSYWRSLS
jgi:hypothetical protein